MGSLSEGKNTMMIVCFVTPSNYKTSVVIAGDALRDEMEELIDAVV